MLLVRCGVDDELAVDHANLGGGAGTGKGDIGNGRCDGGTQHSGQLRAAVGVHGHHDVVQRHVVAVILGEQGTHGAVDHAGGQHCVLGSLSLSLVEAAGDLTHSIKLLLELHAQGEEIDALSGFGGCGCGGQYHCVAIVHENGAVCLGSHSAYLNGQLAPCQVHTVTFEHMVISFSLKSYLTLAEDAETTDLSANRRFTATSAVSG